MASLPTTPDLSSHLDPISGKPERLKNKEAHFMPSQSNPAQSAQHHSRRTGLPSESTKSLRPSGGQPSPGLRAMEIIDQDIPGAFPTEAMLKQKGEEQARALPPPSTVDEVKHAVEVLGDYAKLYLPVSVGAYIGSKQEEGEGSRSEAGITKTELPSTEVPSGSRVGVGSLPGKTSEPAVSALPEEKAGKRFNAMTVPDSGPMSRARRAPFPPSDKVPTGGVGSLPGTPNETDVVRLPEERLHAMEISSYDSHAPSSVVSPQVTQEFPLPQRSSKVSTNPFRNGQFASIGAGQSKPALERRRQPTKEDDIVISKSPGYQREFSGGGGGCPISPGLKEPHATPEKSRSLTPGGHGIGYEASSAIVGQQIVSGEEVETLLERDGVTPRSTLRNPESAVSEGSSAQMTPAPPNIPTPGGSRFHNEPLARDFPCSSMERSHARTNSSREESVTSSAPHPAALATKVSDVPTPAKERVLPEPAGYPPESHTAVEEGQRAPLTAGTAFVGTGVGVAAPIIPAVQSGRGPGQGQVSIEASTTPSTMPSPSKTPSPTRGASSQSGDKLKRKGNPTMTEKLKEESEAKEKSKGFFPRLSDWFHQRKSKSPVKRERERDTSEELKESPDRRGTKAILGDEVESTHPTNRVEQFQQPRAAGEVTMTPGTTDLEGEGIRQRSSRDTERPIVGDPLFTGAIHPGSTIPRGAIREPLSTAFVGTGTLPHQSLHQPPITKGTPVTVPSEHLQGPTQHHSHSHSPVIPKQVPAHFDETIGPLPDHVEKRSKKELPSREKPGGSRVGIGSLPGEEEEEGVILFPEERFPLSAVASVPHTPVRDGVASTPSPDVPPASDIALGTGDARGRSTQSTQEKQQTKPPVYVIPQHRVPQVGQEPSAAVRLGCTPQDQSNPVGYTLHMMQPLQTFQEGNQSLQSEEPHPKLKNKEVQTEASEPMAPIEVPNTHASTGAHALEPIRSSGNGIFSLEHARQEEQERLREIESGQRKTIFTAGRRPQEPVNRVPIRPSQQQEASTLPNLSQPAADARESGFKRSPPPRTKPEASTLATGVPRRDQSMLMSAPTTIPVQERGSSGQNLGPSVTMHEQRSDHFGTERRIADSSVKGRNPSPTLPHLGPSVAVPEQRSVPLGMEPGIAEAEPVSDSAPSAYLVRERAGREGPSTTDEIRSRRPIRQLTPRGSEGQGAQEGFFAGFVHGAEEMIENVGDVVSRHVPESVGEYLPRHKQLEPVIEPRQPDKTPQTQVPTQRRSPQVMPTPSVSMRETPQQALASVPGAQIRAQHAEIQRDIDDLKAHGARPVLPDSTSTIQDPTSKPSAARTRKPVLRVLNDNPTPLELSSHPSRSSSAEDVKPPRAPFSTREQISGNPSDVIPAVREQYVRSIINEPGEMVGIGGSLPGYPGPAALSALIGERIYDEHMRVAGAGEPIQTTTNTLQRQPRPEPVTSHTGHSATELAEQPDLTPGPPTSHLRSTVKPRIMNASALRVPRKHAPGTVPIVSTTAQHVSVSELGSSLTSAPVRAVDLSGGVGVSSLSGQPATLPTLLRSTLREEVSPRVHSERQVQPDQARPPQPGAEPPAAKRSVGKGFGVGDLGAPVVSRETGLKSFIDEQIEARKTSHN